MGSNTLILNHDIISSSPSARQSAHAASNSGSRQYQTAQRLRHTIGTNKVWACDRCYRLKIKCDSGRPSCAACKKHDLGTACTYGGAERTNSSSRRGRRYDTAGYVRMLEARVREVECLLQDKRQQGPERVTPTPSEVPTESYARAHSEHYSDASQYSDGSVSPPRSASQDLFSSEVQRDLVDTFFRELLPFMYCTPFHEPTFLSKLCFDRPDHSYFLVTAICAIAAPYSHNPVVRSFVSQNGLPNYRAGDAYYRRARSIANEIINDPSLELIVGLIWTAAAATAMGRDGGLKSSLLKQALHAALELRLNIDPDVEDVHGVLPWLAKEIRRRVWWLLCSVDVINSLPNDDRPPSIDNRDHPITERTPCLQGWRQTPRAPSPEALFQSVVTENGLPRMSAFVPGVDFDGAESTIGLTKIFGRIKQLRGSAWEMAQKATRRSSPDSDSYPSVNVRRQERIAELEMDLRAWFAALPSWAQNIDQATDFAPSPMSTNPPPWQLLVLHLFYNSAHIALHLPTMLDAAVPHSPYAGDTPEHILVANAYNICRHYAHRSSQLLRRAQELNPSARFHGPWSALFVFYSALVLVIASKTSTDRQHLADVRRDLDAHLRLLRHLGEKWFSANRTLRILMSVIAEGEEADGAVLASWSGNSFAV
ncbi:uncharacterized protein SPPG_02886 [Spizellomyces punctatus DAOM BR117]|uniref:Zn(2)-C6 fungal-type domain-containing protein n=1 Tax=Spizellomyces punctatus (strain DAOM BR117) TaxID=645134 RepID=A0A0L0HNA2_SPIPD|nr:uncharacterized protein SPPG_02886 [Spizellomyces punctatus DAOM BR117]KND02420.1 hypothetical protein SPPG_02886 [Spizellomyces punctatus DAOM BR117]|eukprot:XP_016610459.1 hypothetical protein SPPG_02886 [Spizellomyces punctatus DAOM BR117]